MWNAGGSRLSGRDLVIYGFFFASTQKIYKVLRLVTVDNGRRRVLLIHDGEGVSGNMLVFRRVKSITRQIRVCVRVVFALSSSVGWFFPLPITAPRRSPNNPRF